MSDCQCGHLKTQHSVDNLGKRYECGMHGRGCCRYLPIGTKVIFPLWIIGQRKANSFSLAVTPYIHGTKADAVKEAKRLALENVGATYVVFATIGHATCKEPVEYVECSEVPF